MPVQQHQQQQPAAWNSAAVSNHTAGVPQQHQRHDSVDDWDDDWDDEEDDNSSTADTQVILVTLGPNSQTLS